MRRQGETGSTAMYTDRVYGNVHRQGLWQCTQTGSTAMYTDRVYGNVHRQGLRQCTQTEVCGDVYRGLR